MQLTFIIFIFCIICIDFVCLKNNKQQNKSACFKKKIVFIIFMINQNGEKQGACILFVSFSEVWLIYFDFLLNKIF